MSAVIYDISRPITAQTAVWPGDQSFSATQVLSLEADDAVNLFTLTLSPHTGTHADAYLHYQVEGADPTAMPLEAYVGRARVINAPIEAGAMLPEHFPAGTFRGAERVLFRSHVSDHDETVFPAAFPYLSETLLEVMAGEGIVLVGLDSPSVDAMDSKTLPCHNALQRHGMVNLENLFLRHVPEGDYYLIALPLKLGGVCASPVRAILQPLEHGRNLA